MVRYNPMEHLLVMDYSPTKTKTRTLLHVYLTAVISNIIESYILSTYGDHEHMALSSCYTGHYELATVAQNIELAYQYAYAGCNLHIVSFFAKRASSRMRHMNPYVMDKPTHIDCIQDAIIAHVEFTPDRLTLDQINGLISLACQCKNMYAYNKFSPMIISPRHMAAKYGFLEPLINHGKENILTAVKYGHGHIVKHIMNNNHISQDVLCRGITIACEYEHLELLKYFHRTHATSLIYASVPVMLLMPVTLVTVMGFYLVTIIVSAFNFLWTLLMLKHCHHGKAPVMCIMSTALSCTFLIPSLRNVVFFVMVPAVSMAMIIILVMQSPTYDMSELRSVALKHGNQRIADYIQLHIKKERRYAWQ